jgi:disulfide bond formation protein DsbB
VSHSFHIVFMRLKVTIFKHGLAKKNRHGGTGVFIKGTSFAEANGGPGQGEWRRFGGCMIQPMVQTLRPLSLFLTPDRGWWFIALGASVAVAVAFVAQHWGGMEPCAWCVLQRCAMIVLALLALVLAGVGPWMGRWGRVGMAAGVVMVAGLGLVAAWYQHSVAAHTLSCTWSWADRMLMASRLPEVWPDMFEARASCAQAASSLFGGLPWVAWSGGGFAVTLGWACVWMRGALRRPL